MVILSPKKIKNGRNVATCFWKKEKKKEGDFRHFKFLFLSQCQLLVIFHPQKRTIWNLRARYCTFEINPVILETIFVVGPAFQGRDIVLIIIIEYSSFKGFCPLSTT